MMGQMYNKVGRPLCNALAVWLDKCTSKLGSDLWLNVKNLHLYRAIDLEYVRKVSNIGYKIENYNDKTKYKY